MDANRPICSAWFKILNRDYSRMQGREELFERERHREPVAGWHSCELACRRLENADVYHHASDDEKDRSGLLDSTGCCLLASALMVYPDHLFK